MQVGADFEEQWSNGLVEGWEKENHENGNIQQQTAIIDLDYYSTVEQLMEVGPEKLKEVRDDVLGSSCTYCGIYFK